MGLPPGIQIVAKMRPRSRPVRACPGTDAPDGPPTIDAMPLEIHTQPDPDHFCETSGGPSEFVSQTITSRDGNETMAREVSVDTTVCRPVVSEPQTTAFEDERHARLRALSRSAGTADGVPVTGRCRLLVNCAVSRGAGWPGSAHQPHTAGCLQLHRQTTGRDHHAARRTQMGREERRALLEQRRAAVARQLRRLAIELTDLDRQLDEIEQSER